MSATIFGDERGTSQQPGIVSRHCLSAGPYYDPEKINFGPVIGIDEHLVQPGAGFDWHGHRGVHIVSWVLDGTLRHEDSHGEVRFVPPGVALVQAAADGVRHTETNASEVDALRFLQITIMSDAPAGVSQVALPATVAGVRIDVRRRFPDTFPAVALVVRGEYAIEGDQRLGTGACRHLDRDDHLIYDAVSDDSAVLVLEF